MKKKRDHIHRIRHLGNRILYKGYVSKHKVMKHNMSHILASQASIHLTYLCKLALVVKAFIKIVKACNKGSHGKKKML